MQMDVYLSKYSKAQELLKQVVANEKVHSQNIADIQTELQKGEQILQKDARRQSEVSANIFKIRQQLQEMDRSNQENSEQSVQTTNKIAQLGEELLLLQQQLKSLKQLRALELEPKIAEADHRIRESKDDQYKQQ